ncbi:cyclic nucleotide-binding protein [Polaribacter reichenbachii]|uniref:Cyclic nucleotide-binding protein n=1 Tax=Polaribacter reichenbachii TaxID=996801 RepID=A0A1B8TYH1_9FLAO|nr:Crp/Fnr family transcriptional regulator [Polaribacter reichenbachii]APZ45864.1 cyclic nucleotide-binding protein [Polaribacter reichenbachii]AUC19726.1 cyclic nucleotide-binding protein [Polaribacter reichenbachii]OBY64703.1 cyclic nucleotide-binding protein [Polaribacter reichenbachii]
MTELQKYITSYFGITNQYIDTITSLFKETELKKGDYFTKSGQYCEKLSFVQSGFIRVFANANNKEITQWISTKGYFITDLYSFSFKQRAKWNIQALTDCKLYTIEKENYRLLNKLVPNWAEMEKQFITSCFVQLEDRVFSHLALNSEERYDKLFESNRELFNQVPLQYIASMLGMSPETFSRIRNKKKS